MRTQRSKYDSTNATNVTEMRINVMQLHKQFNNVGGWLLVDDDDDVGHKATSLLIVRLTFILDSTI